LAQPAILDRSRNRLQGLTCAAIWKTAGNNYGNKQPFSTVGTGAAAMSGTRLLAGGAFSTAHLPPVVVEWLSPIPALIGRPYSESKGWSGIRWGSNPQGLA
jgi:hypothetical protein